MLALIILFSSKELAAILQKKNSRAKDYKSRDNIIQSWSERK